MKFSQVPIIFAILVPAIAALPAGETVDVLPRSCSGADDACTGLGGGDLCNDRCADCEGYTRGECGGSLWQVCQCF